MKSSKLLILLIILGLCFACSDDGKNDSVDGDTEVDQEATETEQEAEIEAEQEEEAELSKLPSSLEFELKREDVGEAPTKEEITNLSKKLTSFWKKIEFFKWILRVSHGVDKSTGKRDYMLWWSGVDAYREGDKVRFYHHDPDGGGHNIMIPTPRILASAIGGYFLTGDKDMATIAEQYCKGITATMLGMVYDEKDEVKHLMTRNIATISHTYEADGGRRKEIDYTGWHADYQHWNTHRFEYKNNPYWGSVWVTNIRSKDDIPHLYSAVPHIKYAAEYAEDENVKNACQETLDYLTLMMKDVVDSGYIIRTKDKDGKIYSPGYSGDKELDEKASDIASFVMWEEWIPNAECNAKRTSAIIGYGDGRDIDCGDAFTNEYEQIAGGRHYYNRAIFRHFHLAHIANALTIRDNETAKVSIGAMANRLDVIFDTKDADLPCTRSQWNNDLALMSIRSSSFGLPLTSREAKNVYDKYMLAIDEFEKWEYWDLWAKDLEDGKYPTKPGHVKTENDEQVHWVRIEDMALLLEYCWSPFKNPEGAQFIDCDIISDPTKWE